MKTKLNSKKTGSDPKLIDLKNGMSAIVDGDIHSFLIQYEWIAVKYFKGWYARIRSRNGAGVRATSMHRLIANTPRGFVCHHRNRNGLDNRRKNLLNMTRKEHQFLHANNSLLIKFKEPTSPPPGQSEAPLP